MLEPAAREHVGFRTQPFQSSEEQCGSDRIDSLLEVVHNRTFFKAIVQTFPSKQMQQAQEGILVHQDEFLQMLVAHQRDLLKLQPGCSQPSSKSQARTIEGAKNTDGQEWHAYAHGSA